MVKGTNIEMTKIVAGIKKTKNTSVKNLTVNVIYNDNDGKEVTETMVIKNMYQVWNFIKDHYKKYKHTLGDRITVYQDTTLLKDIHAEEKASGKIWMVDKMQIGKHVKNA